MTSNSPWVHPKVCLLYKNLNSTQSSVLTKRRRRYSKRPIVDWMAGSTFKCLLVCSNRQPYFRTIPLWTYVYLFKNKLFWFKFRTRNESLLVFVVLTNFCIELFVFCSEFHWWFVQLFTNNSQRKIKENCFIPKKWFTYCHSSTTRNVVSIY